MPVTVSDLEILRMWRNSPRVQSTMFDRSYISSEKQLEWFYKVASSSGQYHWTVWKKSNRVGYMTIRNLKQNIENSKDIDVGMYVGVLQNRFDFLGVAIIMAQLDIIFNHLGIPSLTIRVKEDNRRMLKLNKLLGYKEICNDNGVVKLSINHRSFGDTREKMSRYFEVNKIIVS